MAGDLAEARLGLVVEEPAPGLDLDGAEGAACQVVLGKPGAVATRQGPRRGFSVLLHGMSPAASLRLQERGLGELRLLGCGIVVPYKSIAAV